MAQLLRKKVKSKKKDTSIAVFADWLPPFLSKKEEAMAKRYVSTGLFSEAGGVTARILVVLLLAALVLILAKLFSVQNAASVTVWFYNWKFTSTLADVTLLSFCLGALVMALVLLSFRLRSRFRKRAVPPGQKQGGPAAGPAGSAPETDP